VVGGSSGLGCGLNRTPMSLSWDMRLMACGGGGDDVPGSQMYAAGNSCAWMRGER
jgi:hypothetical protein